ncbi:MAG: hypothetical protein MZV64_27360 [Ignavibacteriales bacterium]|nr:hypothetical protein [Ignavibacteriales bacterium]
MAQQSKILQEVRIIPKSIDDYIPIVGQEKIDRLKALAAPLEGKKVLNVKHNSLWRRSCRVIKNSNIFNARSGFKSRLAAL